MNGFTLIEVLIALICLSMIACSITLYFVWMSERSKADFLRCRDAAQQCAPQVVSLLSSRYGSKLLEYG